ncbi:MAG: hypothetical protein ABIN94_03155 [Ferruginibacter sp.]
MKLRNYGFALVTMMCIFAACSVTKEGRSIKKSVSGDWILQTVNTEGITGKFTAKVFNEADFNCFIGSSWNFVANNGTGTYTIVGGNAGCATLERSIRWSIYEPKDGPKEFQFKRLNDKKDPMDDNNGFRLSISMPDDNTMQLKSAITFEGKPGNIVYNFVKK